MKSMSLAQVAERSGVHYGTVYRWITEGYLGIKLHATKYGKSWSVTPDDLDQFAADCKAATLAEGSPNELRRGRVQGDRRERLEASRKRLAAMGV